MLETDIKRPFFREDFELFFICEWKKLKDQVRNEIFRHNVPNLDLALGRTGTSDGRERAKNNENNLRFLQHPSFVKWQKPWPFEFLAIRECARIVCLKKSKNNL